MASPKKDSIGIVGSGITGLACAYFLAKKGYQVTIYEKEGKVGGLAGSAMVNNVPIEMFYHHFFTSDTELLALAKELGVSDRIHFYPSSVGMYIDKKLYPFTTPLDLLTFSPLPLLDRIKMGLVTLYLTKKRSWKDLEKLTVKKFFENMGSPKLYEIIWKPLLEMKFGKYADTVPATFLWGRINPRGRSRKGMGETLGYFDTGFHTFFNALEKKTRELGVLFVFEEVVSIQSKSDCAVVKTSKEARKHTAVIFTGSNRLLLKLCPHIPDAIQKKLLSIQYQAINCMVLEMKKPVSPYYWLNAIDPDISFIGFIEHTNLVPKTMYGRHVAYVFNYVSPNDPLYTKNPKHVFTLYTKDLQKIFPRFKQSHITHWQLFRNPTPTPIYNGAYSKKMPPLKILPRIYLANTSQVYPEDRNVNNGIVLAKKIVECMS